MGAIIEKQNVAKRRKISRPINKSAGFNAGFKQSGFNQSLGKKTSKKAVNREFSRAKKSFIERDHRPGFTMNIPVLPILAVSAGVFVIALAAFNWENININLPNNMAFTPAGETEAERHTIEYASTGIADLIRIEEAQAAEQSAASGQNDLIAFEWQEYKVQNGDSVSKIAQKFNISLGAVIASNNISNARTLRAGTTLRIPNIDGIPHQVKSGDSLSKIAATYNVPLEVILDINDIKSNNIAQGETLFIPGARMNDIDLRMSLGELFAYPIANRFITSHYGMRKDPFSGELAFHTGIDISANIGAPVTASLEGLVTLVSENWLYGKHIIISHDNGYKTLYAHLNSFSVKQGDRVARGRKIAESGNTGLSTGPHLHFSIYDKNNKPVNPLELLR